MNQSTHGTTRARPQATADDPRTSGHGSKSAAARERAIVALLSERTLAAAAKRAGIGERTIRRWLCDDSAFQADLAMARRAIFDAGIQQVQALTGRAVETIEDLLAAETTPAVRLGAARLVVELAVSRQEAETLLGRIEELERLQQKDRAPVRTRSVA